MTYDKKVLEEVFPQLKTYIEGPWGWRTFMDPFSKLANIPCLRSQTNRAAKHENTMLRAMQRIHGQSSCPWMVGCSFQTDGVQMKLLLHTSDLDRPGVPGFKNLPKSGYVGDYKAHTLSDVINRGSGMYPVKKVIGTIQDLQDVLVTALDPGQVLIVDGPRAFGQDFKHENVQNLMELPQEQRCTYSGVDYRVKASILENQVKEALRRTHRNAAYGAAINSAPRRKTADAEEFVVYCKHYAQNQEVIWNEVLRNHRRHNRFRRFRNMQSAVDDVAERVAPMRDKGWTKRLIIFGAALCGATKGAAGAPCKKLVRAICQRAPVLITNEAWTSQTCPGCNRRLKEGPDYRTKLCETVHGCPLHLTTPTKILQRDSVGSLNIGLRGLRTCTRQQIVVQPVDLEL